MMMGPVRAARSFSLITAIIIGCSLSFGCATDRVTGKSTYNLYSMKTDVQLGKQVMVGQLKGLKKKDKPMDRKADPEMYGKIKKMAFKITKVSHVPNFPWEFHLAKVDVVNAWAAPGGKIMVYTGLYDSKKALVKKDNQDEMAAVLAHEIAHATARHVTEALSRNQTIMIAGQVALTAISASGSAAATDLFHNVFVSGVNIYVPAYSRKSESEADRIGLFYMAAAGYDPRAARNLWYRACKKRGNRSSIYASHPSSCSRARALEKHLPAAEELYKQVKAGRKVKRPPDIPS